jgi:putative transcriptional regulator
MNTLQGQILVASPKLVDPNFFHSVVLVVQHGDEGALGLVLNRPLQTTVKEMWAEVGDDGDGGDCEVDGALHQGGPCEGALMVVHSDEPLGEAEVTGGIYFSMQRQAIEELIAQNAAAMKFFVGYAGWTAGQLEAELDEGSWMTVQANAKAVFEGDEHLWSDLVRAISRAAVTGMVDPKRIPDDPSVN